MSFYLPWLGFVLLATKIIVHIVHMFDHPNKQRRVSHAIIVLMMAAGLWGLWTVMP